MKNVLITFTHTDNVMQELKRNFNLHVLENFDVSEVCSLCDKNQIDALLVSHGQILSCEAISKLPPSLKVIATSSVGFDHIDLTAAKSRGIVVTNTPDVLSNATADLAMTLLLNVSRRIKEYSEIMLDGWGQSYGQSEMLGVSLEGKTLGILGMGSIGRAMAKRARAFGMNIAYHNRTRLGPELELDANYFSNFDELLANSDVLSLHAPATAETNLIMNSKSFAKMKKGSILINTARGNLVDEEALMKALDRRHLFGAGLDVFQHEPDFDERFLRYPTVVVTPHMGSATIETRDAMGLLAIKNIKAVLTGATPPTPL